MIKPCTCDQAVLRQQLTAIHPAHIQIVDPARVSVAFITNASNEHPILIHDLACSLIELVPARRK